MIRTQSLVMVLAFTLALAASSAVLPVLHFRDMAPEHACYFICDICLEGGPEQELLSCANNLCGSIKTGATCGPVLNMDLLWLGSQCRNIDLVMQLMGTDTKKH